MALPLTNTPEEQAALTMAWRMGAKVRACYRLDGFWFQLREFDPTRDAKRLDFNTYYYELVRDEVTQR